MRMNGYDRLRRFVDSVSVPVTEESEVNRLKMLLLAAEKDAADSLDWSLLSTYWIQYFTDTELGNSLRCLRRAEDLAQYPLDLMHCASSWHYIAAFLPDHADDVRRCLSSLERRSTSAEELAFCAQAWHDYFGKEAADHVQTLLGRAEEMCEHTWGVKEVVQTWSRVSGRRDAGEEVRNLLLRIGERPETKDRKMAACLAELWLEACHDGDMYKQWLSIAAGAAKPSGPC